MILKSEKHAQRPLFHFLTRLPQRCKNYPQMVSFFNDLEIKKPCSSLVSFVNELEIRKSCSKTSVSFFNKVASEMQKLSSSGFIF
jgi:hypothetical protein